MIKKAYIVCSKYFYKNELFNIAGVNNRDNALYPYYLLKTKFLERGIELNTYDYFNKNSKNLKEGYFLLFLDIPPNLKYFLNHHKNSDKFLIIYESPIINRLNQNIENHKYFKKIFTWNKKLVDNKKYFRLNYAQVIPNNLNFDLSLKNKLLTAVFSHKLHTHPLELYSERIKAIRWFEKNHPEDFDLYGEGWDGYYFKDNLFHLYRFKFLTKLLKPNFPSWRGAVKNKKDVYPRYKFVLCYENTQFPDYITEKIFDCFFNGCVPIYLGAPNIDEYIPRDTFIDKRLFKNYEDLYKFIKNMSHQQYLLYLESIKNFLKSEKMYPFSVENFVNTLIKEILDSN